MFSNSSTGAIPTPSTEPTSTPKITRGHSCVLCFQRKVKCDGQRPCSTCIKARVECITKASSGPRRRRAQVSNSDLLARLRRCEELLESHGVKVEDEVEAQRPIAQQTAHSQDDSGSPESTADIGKLVIERGHSRYIENDLWSELGEELQDSHEMRQTPSDGYEESVTVPSTLYASGDNLLFGRPTPESLRSHHPQPVQMFMLWQKFLDNVNPLVKLLHVPTVQQSILEASSDLGKVAASTEALMFAIYLCAVTSLRNDECERIAGASRHTLIARFSNATQQALINAQILKTSDMVVLQAYTLFLLAMREHYEFYSTWLLAGVANRIGQRMGLHRESASREVSVFEAEMRRRLWWQVLILDFRSAQLSGSKPEPDGYIFDTKRPLNVNDSDLNPNMKEPPIEHPGITDMLFCSIRYEIGEFMRQYKSLKLFDATGQRTGSAVSLAEKDKAINEFEEMLEQKYLRYTDLSIPLHFLSAGLARAAVCQMRLLAHHPRQYPDKGTSLPQSEKDMLFSTSLKMVEYDNTCPNTISIRGYMWHMKVFLQLDAFIYVLSELRNRIEGEEVDRAWQQVRLVFENHPEMVTDTQNSLYFAIGNLALKAWERRSTVAGHKQGLYPVAVPNFITRLRSHRKPIPAPAAKSIINSTIDNASNRGHSASQADQSEDFLGLETSQEFDPSFLATYADMDASPMDWEYWQGLLEGSQWPMMNDN